MTNFNKFQQHVFYHNCYFRYPLQRWCFFCQCAFKKAFWFSGLAAQEHTFPIGLFLWPFLLFEPTHCKFAKNASPKQIKRALFTSSIFSNYNYKYFFCFPNLIDLFATIRSWTAEWLKEQLAILAHTINPVVFVLQLPFLATEVHVVIIYGLSD